MIVVFWGKRELEEAFFFTCLCVDSGIAEGGMCRYVCLKGLRVSQE